MIVGGGGHGLATAYYLATRHGITNVAVLEADYIASGNTGRNTTIIRANYGDPRGDPLLPALASSCTRALEAETGADILHQTEGHRLARPHRDGDADRAGALPDEPGAAAPTTVLRHAGRDQGARPADRPDRRRPLSGPRAPRTIVEARDRAPRPRRLGVRVGRDRAAASTSSSTRRSPGCCATATGSSASRRPRGPIAAGVVLSRGRWPGHGAGRQGRRPAPDPDAPAPRVRHERLRAGASSTIVATTELCCYVSQTERGQMLIGAEFDSQPSYSRQSSFDALRELRLQDHPAPAVPARPADPADVGRHLRHLGRLLPDHGRHRRRRLPRHDGLGDVGLQGDPGRRRGDGRADRDGPARPTLIAPFALDRFRRDQAMADQGSAGTR